MSEDSKRITEDNSIEETIQEETKVNDTDEQQASIKCFLKSGFITRIFKEQQSKYMFHCILHISLNFEPGNPTGPGCFKRNAFLKNLIRHRK